MLKIAMLSYHTCPLATLGGKNTGGMNVYVRELTRMLGRMDVHVDVFTRSQDEHVPHVLHDLGFGNRVVHIPAGPEIPLGKHRLAAYIPDFVQGILEFTEKKNLQYDLIHSHYWMSGLAALQIKEQWQVPIIHMFHTLGVMKNRIARGVDEKESEFRLESERRIIAEADRFIVATLAEQAQLEWLYKADPRKMVVIPPGVNIGHFYPIPADEAKAFIGLNSDERMILFVGRIEPLKGVDTLIRAIALLRQKESLPERPYRVAIIGGDPDVSPAEMTSEMTRLQQLCDELCLGQLVVFLGKRGQDTLPYYYSAADVLVMPSHYESFGMVALEAMACGTPVVASQVGGLAFLVKDGETGYSVPDQDPELLCDRLTLLLNDHNLRQDMGLRAAEYAKEYAWDRIAAQLIHVYDETLFTRNRNFERRIQRNGVA